MTPATMATMTKPSPVDADPRDDVGERALGLAERGAAPREPAVRDEPVAASRTLQRPATSSGSHTRRTHRDVLARGTQR